MPRLMIAAACAALTLALAACGDDKKDSSSPAVAEPTPAATTTTGGSDSSAAGAVVEVSMKNIKFVPETVTAKVGQKVHWTNDDAPVHNVTATDGADFASDTLNNGDTFDYTPTKAGVIKYVCTIHPGQNGEIRVTK